MRVLGRRQVPSGRAAGGPVSPAWRAGGHVAGRVLRESVRYRTVDELPLSSIKCPGWFDTALTMPWRSAMLREGLRVRRDGVRYAIAAPLLLRWSVVSAQAEISVGVSLPVGLRRTFASGATMLRRAGVSTGVVAGRSDAAAGIAGIVAARHRRRTKATKPRARRQIRAVTASKRSTAGTAARGTE